MSATARTLTDDRVAELDHKVDALAEQIAFLAERARAEHDRWQRWEELLHDLAPVAREAFETAAVQLDGFDRAGYVTFTKGGAEVLDRVVRSFDEDDIRQLGDNIVLILQTVKEMTQPEVMTMLQRAAVIAREEEPKQISLLQLLRRMNDPAAKRGLDRILRVLQAVADSSPQPLHTTTPSSSSSSSSKKE